MIHVVVGPSPLVLSTPSGTLTVERNYFVSLEPIAPLSEGRVFMVGALPSADVAKESTQRRLSDLTTLEAVVSALGVTGHKTLFAAAKSIHG